MKPQLKIDPRSAKALFWDRVSTILILLCLWCGLINSVLHIAASLIVNSITYGGTETVVVETLTSSWIYIVSGLGLGYWIANVHSEIRKNHEL